jgi:hypothetical protein
MAISGIFSNDKRILSLLFLIVLFFFPFEVFSQDLNDFNQKRVKINKTGMIILGSWAAGNIVMSPLIGRHTSGSDKYFHQMNAMWNSVNLVIAGIGYYGAMKENAGILTGWQSVEAQQSIEKILLVNSALDVAYIIGGLYLMERANRNDNPDRLNGFGKSIILQGSFLLAFDVIMYAIHNSNGNDLPNILKFVALTPQGISFTHTF